MLAAQLLQIAFFHAAILLWRRWRLPEHPSASRDSSTASPAVLQHFDFVLVQRVYNRATP
jgi:hypothetical protein